MSTISTICMLGSYVAAIGVLIMGHLSHRNALRRAEDWDSR